LIQTNSNVIGRPKILISKELEQKKVKPVQKKFNKKSHTSFFKVVICQSKPYGKKSQNYN
jgi:hypothetical protein